MAVTVVVVGNGMVGARFVEELRLRDREGRFDVALLGAEPYEPYNRVLLSDLIAGTVPAASLVMGSAVAPAAGDRAGRLHVRRGCQAVAIDRDNQCVLAADGSVHRYDVLVLATGADARIPPIDGLTPPSDSGPGDVPGGVHVLRTLDDARAILAGTLNARTAVVVGGGVLGLEVAAGLARRWMDTTIVHPLPALMERNLDVAASDVVVASLADAGVHSALDAAASEVETSAGRVTGLRLTDGRVLPAQLVVLAVGAIPAAGLARDAGLTVERGIRVQDDLASPDDPRIHAIGDCAQPPEGATGLVAQGWDQARRLAARLTSASFESWPAATDGTAAPAAPPDPGTDVVRVKAAGLDLVSMGLPTAQRGQHRVVRLSDPAARRHIEIIVDGDRLVGATCVGAGQAGADIAVTYTRGSPLPTDPAQLLVKATGAAPEQASSPMTMPDRLTVCRCNGVTKREIVDSWSEGANSVADVAARTRATTGCGGCTDLVCGIVDWLAASDPRGADAPISRPDGDDSEVAVPAGKHSPHDAEISAG